MRAPKDTVRGHHSPPPITPATSDSPQYIPPHKRLWVRPMSPTYVSDLRVRPTWLTYVSDLRVRPTWLAYVSTLRIQLSDHIIILIIYLR